MQTTCCDKELYEAAARVIREAAAAHVTLATAESCTGGLVAGALTAVPGSSEVFLGSVVSYAIEVKQKVLGVSEEIFAVPELGAVSEPCAQQMAQGVRRTIGSELAVSTTGIAGPGGSEPGKPVGTVWFGVASAHGVHAGVKHFDGSRDDVRREAVLYALQLFHEEIVKK
ncbi:MULTISPECIES: CinA family protein [Atopobiaceae]|uniref:CinA family protein n=1 Tax=Atopobiaceae TaxID=1643824 RepID=UPI00034E419B|nr:MULTISPECIES: CinA family protein [Atopobiaceae]EPD78115.1 competence/damage-inducible protein CinA [Atopobium sp. oral taxon 199 str. F0494]